ncbi:MAG: malto-oligosyltrehalose trehalohydrolase [Verrucomicrobia bacterium]|nr:malto-oligosyltrehalose trehalohydrolase [Verrucomicrobiota bacterium]
MRNLPIGAEVQRGGVHFRIWAPASKAVKVRVGKEPGLGKGAVEEELRPEGTGYFSGVVEETEAGDFYHYVLDSGSFPDPASRFQPAGPHEASQVIDPRAYAWKDDGWAGAGDGPHVIYEMHVGTFTEAGTWAAAAELLPGLAELGITILEIMPIADFPGRFGWGYDGVSLFAPTRLYGSPDDVRAFVDRAHAQGLAVILDVVYNHLGPDGNYLTKFSQDYFTDRYQTEWGEPFNFDGPNSKPVREYFLANVAYWIREFHFDGFRFDATQQIFDASPKHILVELSQAARESAGPRKVYLVAENEPQDVRIIRSQAQGGYALDAIWNDDFHHSAIVALTGKREAYYTDYQGLAQEFVSAVRFGFLYQGQYYHWQQKARGTPSLGVPPQMFVNFLQNHDQVANSLGGHRIHTLAAPGAVRTATALLLLGPWTPMLFQGQEFAASTPFLYFADHVDWLAEKVAAGRTEFLKQFPSLSSPEIAGRLPSPEAQDTFKSCRLRNGERLEGIHGQVFELHRDLIQLKKNDPVLAGSARRGLDAQTLSQRAFLVRYFGEIPGDDRLLICNLDHDVEVRPAPFPLLAPPPDRGWKVLWTSEHPTYGGQGLPLFQTAGPVTLPGLSAILLGSETPQPCAG